MAFLACNLLRAKMRLHKVLISVNLYALKSYVTTTPIRREGCPRYLRSDGMEEADKAL